MKKIVFIFLFLCFLCCNLFSEDILKVISRTNTAVCRPDIFSPFQNAATLANVEKFETSLFFQNKFLLKELSTKGMQIAVPTHFVNFGLAFSSFGYSEYNENIFGLSFARKFSDKLMLATQFDYYSVYFSKNEGSKGKVLVQVGILSKPIEDLYIGFQVFNPVQTNIETAIYSKELPSIFSLGMSYSFSEKLLWAVQADKDIRFKTDWATEFEYRIEDYFLVKLGCFHNETFIPSMGFGLNLSSFRVDTNFAFHSTLGVSSNIALTYKLK